MTKVSIILCFLVLWTAQLTAGQDGGDAASLPNEEEEIFFTVFTTIEDFLRNKQQKIAEKIRQKTDTINTIKESNSHAFGADKRFSRDLEHVQNYLKNKFEKIGEKISQKDDSINEIKELKRRLNEDGQIIYGDFRSIGYDQTRSLIDKLNFLKSMLDKKAQIITDKIVNVSQAKPTENQDPTDDTANLNEETVVKENKVKPVDKVLVTTEATVNILVSDTSDFNLESLLNQKKNLIQQKIKNKLEGIETGDFNFEGLLKQKQNFIQEKIENKMKGAENGGFNDDGLLKQKQNFIQQKVENKMKGIENGRENLQGLLKQKQNFVEQKIENKLERIENALESADGQDRDRFPPHLKAILDQKHQMIRNIIQNKLNRIFQYKSVSSEESTETDSNSGPQSDDTSSDSNDESAERDEHSSEEDNSSSESNDNSSDNSDNSSNSDSNSSENSNSSSQSKDSSSESNDSSEKDKSSENDSSSSQNDDNNSSDSSDSSSNSDDNSIETVSNKLNKRDAEYKDLIHEMIKGFIPKIADILAKKDAFAKARNELYNFTTPSATSKFNIIGGYNAKRWDMMAKKREWIKSKIALKAEIIETMKNISVKLEDTQVDFPSLRDLGFTLKDEIRKHLLLNKAESETSNKTVRTENLSNQHGIHMALASTNEGSDTGSSMGETLLLIGCLAVAVTAVAVAAVYFVKKNRRKLYSHM